MKRLLRLLGLGLGLLSGALLLVLFSAGTWLETETGRSLLQSELSRSMGMTATLGGEYSLRIFPGLHISGRQLVFRDSADGLAVANLESYELRLALWPLLRKRVDIHKVALRQGSFDLDAYATATGNGGSTGKPLVLPRIRAMDISGLKLLRSSGELLLIESLSLNDFSGGKRAPLRLVLALHGSNSSAGLALVGTVELKLEPLELSLFIEESELSVGDQAWQLGQGQLSWDGPKGLLWGNMEGVNSGFDTGLQWQVQSGDPMLIRISAAARSPADRLLTAGLVLIPQNDEWLISDVVLDLDGQELSGAGCFSTGNPPSMQMQLQSSSMDLDVLREILPVDSATPVPDETREGSPLHLDLPIGLGIEVQVQELVMDGVTAREVRMQIGSKPACSSPGQAKGAGTNENQSQPPPQ